MVVRPGGVRIAGNQLAAADVTNEIMSIRLNNGLAVGIEDKLHQAAVFFHLMAQALGVVAVDLDIAVKGRSLNVVLLRYNKTIDLLDILYTVSFGKSCIISTPVFLFNLISFTNEVISVMLIIQSFI